jgi:hypothetical protein
MRKEHADELIEFGKKIQVKVTTSNIKGILYVNFRDYQLSSFIQAAVLLQNIQRAELPESFSGLAA